MEPLPLHFNGALTFTEGARSLFHSPFRDDACVYLWTIKSDFDQKYYIHYIGEAESFAKRQREHLIQILVVSQADVDG